MVLTLFVLIIVSLVIIIFVAYNKSNRFDDIMKGNAFMQFILLVCFVAVVFGLMILAYDSYKHPLKGNESFLSHLRLFGLFSQTVNADPTINDTSVFVFQLFVSIIGAVCFGGILISTISNIFQRRIDAYAKGEVRYRLLSNHDIIIGANELLEPALRHLKFKSENNANRKSRKVLVVTAKDAKEVRSRIRQIGTVADKNIIIYQDNILCDKLISQLHLFRCKQVIIIGDAPVVKCDLNNTNIADLLYRHFHAEPNSDSPVEPAPVDKKHRPLPVFVSYFDDSYFLSFCKEKKATKIYFYPFNYNEMCIANVWGYKQFDQLLSKEKDYTYPALSGNLDKGPLRLFILGFNAMGQEVLKAAVKWAHFSNSDIHPTQIHVFTQNLEAMSRFQRRYPNIKNNVHDIDISYHLQTPFSNDVMKILEDAIRNETISPYIVICSDNSIDNFTLATSLPSDVYVKSVPVLVQFEEANHTIVYDFHKNNVRFKNVHFFGYYNNDIPFFFGLELAQDLAFLMAKRKRTDVKGTPRTRWERFSFDNSKQTRICHINGLSILLKEVGLRVVEGTEGKESLLNKKAMEIFQKQFVGWNTLAGYSPTETPTSDNDWIHKKVNMLFTYEELERAGGEAYIKRKQSMEDYINDIMLWLQNHNKSLEKRSS